MLKITFAAAALAGSALADVTCDPTTAEDACNAIDGCDFCWANGYEQYGQCYTQLVADNLDRSAMSCSDDSAKPQDVTCDPTTAEDDCNAIDGCDFCWVNGYEDLGQCYTQLVADNLDRSAMSCSDDGSVRMEPDAKGPASHPDWKLVGEANPRAPLKLVFAVKQGASTQELEEALLAVSDPRSPRYGQHWTREQVAEFTAPKPESVAAVHTLLARAGVAEAQMSINGDMVHVVTDVATAEKLLGCKYEAFRHRATGRLALRARSYSLPADVAEHVDFVAPTVRLPATRALIVNDDEPDLTTNTPDVLRDLYSVGDAAGSNNPAAKQAVASFLEQYVSESDLSKFWDTYMPSANATDVAYVGTNKDSRPGIESMLDIETISTVGALVNTEVWYTDGRAPDNPDNEPFLDWLYSVGNTTDADVPRLFSVSYGEDEDSVSMDYANRIVQETQEQGLRGISIMFASGDSGVGSATDSCTTFAPQWPSASPYVTAVGGTHSSDPEKGAGLSSGGFSNRWSRPSWQTDAVADWASSATDLPDAGLYNQTGRGFPDVAAQAMNFNVVIYGTTMPGVAGTSAACPTFSGVIGLINDARIAAGKSSLGFLNPFIYQNMDAFNDITEGNNPGCGTDGFTAQKGWDPVTGAGTPNYEKLLEAAMALP